MPYRERKLGRELADGETRCRVEDCVLPAGHACHHMPRVGAEESPEMTVENLIQLSLCDPEGFMCTVRELLRAR